MLTRLIHGSNSVTVFVTLRRYHQTNSALRAMLMLMLMRVRAMLMLMIKIVTVIVFAYAVGHPELVQPRCGSDKAGVTGHSGPNPNPTRHHPTLAT